jgi:release factor glutamine methyltransferase
MGKGVRIVLSVLIAIVLNFIHKFLWRSVILRDFIILRVFIPFYFISSKLVLEASNVITQIANVKNICEIGTGSGFILIKLVEQHRNVYGVAIDLSEDAVKVTKVNAKIHSVFNQIDIVQCRSGECFRTKSFDLCYSNPPYLPCPETLSLNICCGTDEKIFKEIFLNILRISKSFVLISSSSLTLYSNILSKYSLIKLVLKKFTGLDTISIYLLIKDP